MGKYREFLKLTRERFERYQTYYQILGISPVNVNDETVREAYDKKNREIEKFLANYEQGNEEIEEIEEIKTIIQTALDDAYAALKDENSRRNYQELLNHIDEKEDYR